MEKKKKKMKNNNEENQKKKKTGKSEFSRCTRNWSVGACLMKRLANRVVVKYGLIVKMFFIIMQYMEVRARRRKAKGYK